MLEAVFEELEVKQQVFAELREHTGPDCVLATNTSSLSVEEMGADVGIHFFNPVAVLPLVELVRTPSTDDADARHRLGASPRGCASGRCSSPTRRRSSSTAS